MLFGQVSLTVLSLAVLTEAARIPDALGLAPRLVRRQNNFGGSFQQEAKESKESKESKDKEKEKGSNGGSGTSSSSSSSSSSTNSKAAAAAGPSCLDPTVIQKASASDGNAKPADGQSASAIDANNFINFCKGQTLTNGLQVKTGSCNGIVMGKIPSTTNMISSIITSPTPNEDLDENKTFTVSIQTKGLAAGTFTNPQETYYSAPQNLDASGKIMGHTHLTIQDLGSSLKPSQPPDPATFVFFKGINDAGTNGLLSAVVTGGLPAGNYRACSMNSAANHQPVMMPVAQRGAQDDCQKFTVGAAKDKKKTGK